MKLFLAAAAFVVASAMPAMAEDLAFTLTNQSSSGVIGFYVSHTGTNAWEENLIEGGVLPAGNEIEIEISDGRDVCEYDIKAEFEDGSSHEDYDLNLCDTGSYTFSDAN